MSFLCSSSSPTRPCPSDLYSLISYPYHTSFHFFYFLPSGGFSVPPSICCSPGLEHPSLSSSTSQHLLVLLLIAAQAPCPQKSLFWPPWVGQNLPQALIAPGIYPLDLTPLKFCSFCHHLTHRFYPPHTSRWAEIVFVFFSIGSPELDKVSGIW